MAAANTNQHDVVVVGGGVVGLACAWRAAERGLRVLVLERDRPGAGASNVAAGMLAPVGEATFGEDRLLELALESHRLWPRFAADLAAAGGETGYVQLGALHVALDRDEAAELRRRFELMRSHDLASEWLRPSACRELEPGLASVAAGVLAPHEAAVDPRSMVGALAGAFEAAGGVIETEEVAEAVIDGERLAGVRTRDGREHRALTTVLAAGSWSASEWLPSQARPPIRAVKGQILTLRGPAGEPVCERIVVTERVYMVPRADGRLVVGATVEEQGFDTRITAGGVHELLREAYRTLPDVAELELVEAIAGLRPATPDNMPLIGPGALDGLVLATGHFRNGILLAPVTADRVAAHLAGEPAETLAEVAR
ncbi:MAG TPA: glycine oxidase ThiO [Solirubrobacterales bacterium]|nr:glycine oxidase ThiO [Solirubrobacterales bacterium]